MPFFLREAEIIIGQPGGEAISIKDLRFEFNITKTSTKTANSCTLKIYNAKPENITLLETVNNIVIIRAGYKQNGGAAPIFTGTAFRSLTIQDGDDIVTELELRDGAIPLRDAKISVSWPPNTAARTVLYGVAGNFGFPLKVNDADIPDRQYVGGFAHTGRAREAMDKVCNFIGMEWSIQDNEIQVIKKGGTTGGVAVVLSKDTGMIGHPRREAKTMTEKAAAKDGVKYGQKGIVRTVIDIEDPTAKLKEKTMLEVQGYRVKSLLNHMIYPGSYVQLSSRGVKDEFFRVEEARYTGDTHVGEWVVEALLRYV